MIIAMGVILAIVSFLFGMRTNICLFSNIKSHYDISSILLLIIIIVSGYYVFSLSNTLTVNGFWVSLIILCLYLGWILGSKINSDLNSKIIRFCHVKKTSFIEGKKSYAKDKDLSEVFGGRTW